MSDEEDFREFELYFPDQDFIVKLSLGHILNEEPVARGQWDDLCFSSGFGGVTLRIFRSRARETPKRMETITFDFKHVASQVGHRERFLPAELIEGDECLVIETNTFNVYRN